MATRRNMKGNNGNKGNVMTRKNMKGNNDPMAGGKRKLAPMLKKWNMHVMDVYRKMKKTNKNYKLRDAMKAAKKTFRKH